MSNERTVDTSSATVGEALIALLEQAGVDTVFGIPGVHTIELYRGLAASAIRHVTPRHEQGAAFMADGYARTSGKPGVCLLITGPGLTNAITAMAQARADSVPMLVISGVNALASLGKGLGHLHELPDQAVLARAVALRSYTLTEPERLASILADAFDVMTGGRPGPVHIEIPTDVMAIRLPLPIFEKRERTAPSPSREALSQAASLCRQATKPVLLCGGGAARCSEAVRSLAERLDSPVVSTINARGVMAGHALDLPASPSLAPVRALIEDADLVLAIGTELGPTDYELYQDGPPAAKRLIRVDIDQAQLERGPEAILTIQADAGAFMHALAERLGAAARAASSSGAARAEATRKAALAAIDDDDRSMIAILQGLWKRLPEAIVVGDSTQPIYAGNLYIETPAPATWFNAATGYGTLGYAAPAAIGAALGAPDRPVLCLIGDGGLQFTLAELGTAGDCAADVAFIVWNNAGYREIEKAMVEADVTPVGVDPSAPDFVAIAKAYDLPARRAGSITDLERALADLPRPCLIEFDAL